MESLLRELYVEIYNYLTAENEIERNNSIQYIIRNQKMQGKEISEKDAEKLVKEKVVSDEQVISQVRFLLDIQKELKTKQEAAKRIENEPNFEKIGEQVKIIRKNKKLSQSVLADALGVTKQTISAFEKGKMYSWPGNSAEDALYKLSSVLDCTPDYILGLSIAPNWDRNCLTDPLIEYHEPSYTEEEAIFKKRSESMENLHQMFFQNTTFFDMLCILAESNPKYHPLISSLASLIENDQE